MDPGTIIAVIVTTTQVLSLLTKYYQGVHDARTDVERLKSEIQSFQHVLQKIQELLKSSNGTRLSASSSQITAIAHSVSSLEELKDKLDPSHGKRIMKRVGLRALKWPLTKQEVNEYMIHLERCKGTLNLAFEADHISLTLGIDEKINLAEEDRQLAKLSYADGAAFNSKHHEMSSLCNSDTRVGLLRQLQEWSSSKDNKCIFWLSGMAGTGKSTIARTVARTFFDQKRLGASFFFSRGAGDLGHATKFVTTLACQLANLSSVLRLHVVQAIAEHNNVDQQGLRNQWKELVLQPLSKLNNQNPTLILVIDALDECDHEESIKLILQLFVEAKNVVAEKLKILVTSRPETPIRLGFRDMPEIIYQDLVLHDIPRSVVEHDIGAFVKDELRGVNPAEGWPGDDRVKLLVERSDCLFIYAATACRFIKDPDWCSEERLDLILQGDIVGESPTAKLDNIYAGILKHSVIKNRQNSELFRLSERFRKIVGAVVVIFDVLSAVTLANLLSISIKSVNLTFISLHSILNIPKNQDLPVRLLHPSFRDFLLNKNRCSDENFWIDQEIAHKSLVEHCLNVLNHTLKRNICNLRAPGTLMQDVKNDVTKFHISKETQYACRYWVEHLNRLSPASQVEVGLHDNGQIYDFFQKHFLHWLETLSLMRQTSEAVRMIKILEAQLESNAPSSFLNAIVHDARRFILKNRSIIEEAPLQVYASALVFSPKFSLIREQFSNQLPSWIVRYPVVDGDWSSLSQTLEGHQDFITSVVFSSDGKLASGSWDSTVRLWDSATGGLQSTLTHSSNVNALGFSTDGKQLAAGSQDGLVQLWDSVTGARRNTLRHSRAVDALAFSSDGKHLASGSQDGFVRLWDSATGALQITLEHPLSVIAIAFSSDGKLATGSTEKTVRLWDWPPGALWSTFQHPEPVTAVAFSSDGKQLASGSDDGLVRLWDSVTGVLQRTFKHSSSVYAVAFSSDGKHLASGSADNTVRLWDSVTRAVPRILEHSDSVIAIAFSSDGKQLASGSEDSRVRLWDLAAEETPYVLENHSKRISAVAFSSDGKQLASGSEDRTVQIWDSATGALQRMLEGHSKMISAIAFSNDGKLLASGSEDHTLRLWDLTRGTSRSTLEGHYDNVSAVAFSSDGKLASGSYDCSVRLWDSATGALQSMLEEHSNWISAVAFSSDGKQLASGSWDSTVRIWDSATGALQCTLEGHSNRIHAVAFSSDGKQLASSGDYTVRLWDPADGRLLRKFDVGGVSQISFSVDGSCIQTDRGWIYLDADRSPFALSYHWMIEQNWFTRNNCKMLWLPPEFRPECSTSWNKRFAIGHASGRITILEFNESFDDFC